jgi:hypothetical protein
MTATSEHIVIMIIWILTAVGIFFGGRGAWRRRRQDRNRKKK